MDSVSPIGLDRAKAASLIKAKGLVGVLFTSPENVFYTTGAHTLPGTGNPILYALKNQIPTFSFIDAEGAVTLFIWMGATMGIDYVGADVRTFLDSSGAAEELGSFLEEQRKKGPILGIESSCPYWASNVANRATGGVQTVQADEIALRLRLVKSAAELERIRKSTQIVEETVAELKKEMNIGMSRAELAQAARLLMMKHGATGIDHLTIAFGASNPEVMLDERLERGQLITIDLGAVYEGYVSDNRRLFYTAEAPPEGLSKLHRSLVGIVEDVGAALTPGASFSELYSRAVSLYEKEGLQPMFFHVGHSIGIQTEETWISAESELVVEENMVLNIELYSPDEGGTMIGDEETFVVGKKGSEKITQLPNEIGLA